MDPKTALKQFNKLKKKSSSMCLAAENWETPFQTLVATILSARSRDEKTLIVARALFQKFPTAEKLSQAYLDEIQKIIRPVNFYNAEGNFHQSLTGGVRN